MLIHISLDGSQSNLDLIIVDMQLLSVVWKTWAGLIELGSNFLGSILGLALIEIGACEGKGELG